LPDPGAEAAAIRLGLDLTVSRFSRDAAWFGLTRWRELIAQFFDPSDHVAALSQIDSVSIVAETPGTQATAPPRLALWLAAWLAGQLHWRPQGQPDRSGGTLRASFKGPAGPISLAIETLPVPELTVAQLRETTLTVRPADGVTGVGGSRFRLSRV